jgi:hypothetical protein
MQIIEFIAGSVDEIEPKKTIQMVRRFHSVLGLEGLALRGEATLSFRPPAWRSSPVSRFHVEAEGFNLS